MLILTLNEEINLEDCIDSCGWCDDIVVFDSFSTDNTPAIASAKGARFVQRRFDNYASQRNAALNQISFKHPWILMLDADERTPPDLVAEMAAAVAASEPDTVLFRMRRKDFFLGRWLRRSSGYPSWFGRLVRRGTRSRGKRKSMKNISRTAKSGICKRIYCTILSTAALAIGMNVTIATRASKPSKRLARGTACFR